MPSLTVKHKFRTIICSLILGLSGFNTVEATPLYLFEYTGTVRIVGGSVTDGSLLNFSLGDEISGAFIFDAAGFSPLPSATSTFQPYSIDKFYFSNIQANGNQASYSYFSLDALRGFVNAYKQVGTGQIYDNYSFVLSPDDGVSPFVDVSFDLTTLKLSDFAALSVFPNSRFSLQRVDISSSPLQYTDVVAFFKTLNVSAIPESTTLALMTFGLAGIGFIRRKGRD